MKEFSDKNERRHSILTLAILLPWLRVESQKDSKNAIISGLDPGPQKLRRCFWGPGPLVASPPDEIQMIKTRIGSERYRCRNQRARNQPRQSWTGSAGISYSVTTSEIWHWRELELCLSSPSCQQILVFNNRKSVGAVATLALENSSSLLRVCLPTEQ